RPSSGCGKGWRLVMTDRARPTGVERLDAMRSVERDILLASSGELGLCRRAMLWLRLRFGVNARRYSMAERALRGAAGQSAPAARRIVVMPYAVAAAVLLAVVIWRWVARSTADGDVTPHGLTATAMLDTPAIQRTRQLVIRAELGAPPAALEGTDRVSA